MAVSSLRGQWISRWQSLYSWFGEFFNINRLHQDLVLVCLLESWDLTLHMASPLKKRYASSIWPNFPFLSIIRKVTPKNYLHKGIIVRTNVLRTSHTRDSSKEKLGVPQVSFLFQSGYMWYKFWCCLIRYWAVLPTRNYRFYLWVACFQSSFFNMGFFNCYTDLMVIVVFTSDNAVLACG